jgi:hypothetical protein
MSYMKNDVQYAFSRRDACSETDDGFRNFSHNMMDFGWDAPLQRNIPRMIRGAASIEAIIDYKPEKNNAVQVQVAVTSTKAGHKFPTDSPLRQLILIVEAKDQFSNLLMQMGDGRIPNWGGIQGSGRELPGITAYAGQPGKIFANLIVQTDNQIDNSLAYWDQGLLTPLTNGSSSVDNRLEPGRADLSSYYFALPADGEVKLTVSLFYRFAPYDLIRQMYPINNLDRTDVLVAVLECLVNVFEANHFDCKPTPS